MGIRKTTHSIDLTVNKLDRETFDSLSASQIVNDQLYFITSADTVVVDCNPQTGGTSTTWRKWDAFHQKHPGLRFTALQPNSTVSMRSVGSPPSVNLEYSTDDGITWQTFTVGTTTVTLDEIGDSFKMRASSTTTALASSTDDYNQFVMTGEISASDSIMYLLDKNGSDNSTMADYAFNHLFTNCSSLVYAPELPSTSVSPFCYNWMFNGCTNLAVAPELPATTVYALSYQGMFENCTSLAETPELPATTLGNSCYNAMFKNCTSLSAASELPSDWLATDCYYEMFYGCTSLATAPQMSPNNVGVRSVRDMFKGCTSLSNLSGFSLPATTLEQGCYIGTFYGCTSLTDAPKMDFTSTQQNSLEYMFSDCSALSSIELSRYEGDFETSAFTDWVRGVSQSGTLYYLGSDTSVGDSAIPTGWNVTGWDMRPLEIRARNAGTVVSSTNTGSPTQKQVEYSTDGGQTWSDFIFGYTQLTLNEAGDSVQFRAKTSNSNICDSWQNYWKFTTSDTVDVMGNLNSLLRRDPQTDSATLDGSGGAVFYGLFRDTKVVDASNLVLPWTAFTGNAQFEQMFYNCSYLISAPELPATSITGWSYKQMFYGCSSLATAPTLPATTVYDYSYEEMFRYCSNLNEIRINYTGDFSPNAFTNWVEGVASSGTFYYNGSDTTTGYSAIPYNWSVQTFV